MMYDTYLIADVYERLKEAERNHYQVDVDREAEGLSMLMRPLGRRNRRVAVVPEDKPEVLAAYRRAGFSIRTMNGNRPTELISFLSDESRSLRVNPPGHLIVVTTDPAFDILCSSAADHKTKVSIWAPSANVPPQLTHPDYDYRQLEELLPGTKIKVATVAVYLDYENIHIGLERMGVKPEPQAIIEAVRAEIADLGNIEEINAHADWQPLSNSFDNRDIQRELALLGVKTHYEVGVPGKSSADMAMANDIRTRVDRAPDASDAIDTVVLGTRDGDFSTIVETAKARSKKVVILALRDGLSSKLAKLAEVRYLDTHLAKLDKKSKATDEQFTLLMKIAAYLTQNGWSWVWTNKLKTNVITGPNGDEQISELVEAGMVEPAARPGSHRLAFSHPDAYIAWWVCNRINYNLNKKGLQYVDTNFLFKGMKKDGKCQQFGIGRTWHEAKNVLNRMAATDVIIKKQQPLPKGPDKKIIDTWWLTAQDDKPTDVTHKKETEQNTTVKETPGTGQSVTIDIPQPKPETPPKQSSVI